MSNFKIFGVLIVICVILAGIYLLIFNPSSLFSESEIFEYLQLTSSNNFKIYVMDLPHYAHTSMSPKIVDNAIQSWVELNPDLNYIFTDDKFDADITIQWVTDISHDYSVLGLTEADLFIYADGSTKIIKSKILIDLIDVDCNGDTIFYDNETVSHTIKHEIGHTLGLGHSSDENHLMFDPGDGVDDFDSLGFFVPASNHLYDYFVGEKTLHDQLDSGQKQLDAQQSIYDQNLEKYDEYSAETSSQHEYALSEILYVELLSQNDEINELIDETNLVIDELNCLRNEDLGSNQPSSSSTVSNDVTFENLKSKSSYASKIYVTDLPSYALNYMTPEIVNDAIQSWVALNPDLNYIFIDNESDADITIHWVDNILYETPVLGIAKSNILVHADGFTSVIFDVEIDLVGTDCNGDTLFYNYESVLDTLKHEIGHTLGLEHSSDEDHLMFSPYDGVDNFDSLGFSVPVSDNLYDYFIGEENMHDNISSFQDKQDVFQNQLDSLEGQQNPLVNSLESLQSEYDQKIEEYDQNVERYDRYRDQTLSTSEHAQSELLYLRLSTQLNQINELVNKMNLIGDEINLINDKMNLIIDKMNLISDEWNLVVDEIECLHANDA